MDEVDYSRYLYRPEQPTRPPKQGKDRSPKHRPVRPTWKRVVTIVIVVVVCFSILFLWVDFFAKGNVTRSIYSLIVKTEYVYYFVASSYATRDMAHAGALAAENAGGAGYLFAENGNYYVLYGVYHSKTDAQKVIDRNTNYFLYTLSYKVSDTELANLIDGLIRDVSLSLNGMDAGTFTEGSLQTVLNNYSLLFAAFESDNDEEIALASLDPIHKELLAYLMAPP